MAAWEEIGTRLAPILGRRGVAALYRRSLQLTLSSHRWLAPACEAQEAELAALHATLASQDRAAAVAASVALLANFRVLLTGLVGDALTAKLLAPPQGAPADDPAKEPPP